MEIELEPLEPCFVGPVRVKALSATDKGDGWASPCPQIHIEIGHDATGAAIIGYDAVKLLRDMCNHALSAGEWWDSNLPESEKKKKPPKCLHVYDYTDYTETHTVCRKCGFKSPRPDPKWPDFVYHAPPCMPGSMKHDWHHGEVYGVCKKCFTIGEKHEHWKKEFWGNLIHRRALAKTIANITINDLLKHCNEKACKVNDLGLKPGDIAWLAGLIIYDILDSSKVTTVIDHFIKNGGDVKEIVTQLDLWPAYDNKLEEMVNKVIEENPKAVKEILGGKKQAFGFLMGRLKQVDKKIDSKEAMELLKEKIQ